MLVLIGLLGGSAVACEVGDGDLQGTVLSEMLGRATLVVAGTIVAADPVAWLTPSNLQRRDRYELHITAELKGHVRSGRVLLWLPHRTLAESVVGDELLVVGHPMLGDTSFGPSQYVGQPPPSQVNWPAIGPFDDAMVAQDRLSVLLRSGDDLVTAGGVKYSCRGDTFRIARSATAPSWGPCLDEMAQTIPTDDDGVTIGGLGWHEPRVDPPIAVQDYGVFSLEMLEDAQVDVRAPARVMATRCVNRAKEAALGRDAFRTAYEKCQAELHRGVAMETEAGVAASALALRQLATRVRAASARHGRTPSPAWMEAELGLHVLSQSGELQPDKVVAAAKRLEAALRHLRVEGFSEGERRAVAALREAIAARGR